MNSTVFYSICLAALIPLNSFAVTHNNTENNTDTNRSQVNSQHENVSAIQIILQDHKQIKKMIGQLETSLHSDSKESRAQFQNLKDFLVKHETMEQKVWYPELEKYDDLKDILQKVKDEEETASNELKDLDNITDDKEWKTKVKKLIKDVKNHAKDEETKLFPKVKKVVSPSLLNQIGQKMEDYKSHQ